MGSCLSRQITPHGERIEQAVRALLDVRAVSVTAVTAGPDKIEILKDIAQRLRLGRVFLQDIRDQQTLLLRHAAPPFRPLLVRQAKYTASRLELQGTTGRSAQETF